MTPRSTRGCCFLHLNREPEVSAQMVRKCILDRRKKPLDPFDIFDLPFERFDARALQGVTASRRLPQFFDGLDVGMIAVGPSGDLDCFAGPRGEVRQRTNAQTAS